MKHIYYGKYNSKPIPYSVKIIILWLLMYDSPIKGTCGGFSTWDQKTPYGNTIWHENVNSKSNTFIICDVKSLGDKKIVEDLHRWYYYNGHVCGEFFKGNYEAFFIFNEKNCTPYVYDDKTVFQNILKKNKLKPILWTRWFYAEGDWGQAYLIVYLIPIFLIFVLSSIIGLFITRFNIKHPFNKVTLTIIMLIVIWYWLDVFQSSI